MREKFGYPGYLSYIPGIKINHMKQKELFKLLDGIQEQGEETVKSERILRIQM